MSATNRGTTRQRADFYTTPTGCTTALAEHLIPGTALWEPACGANAITAELIRHGHKMVASDLHDYSRHPEFTGQAIWRQDFLTVDPHPLVGSSVGIVTNPPFSLAADFWAHSCVLNMPVALLTRVNLLGGTARVELFTRCPPTHLFALAPRPSFAWVCRRCRALAERGQPRCSSCGQSSVGPGSDATEYAWLVRDPDNKLVTPGPALRFLVWSKLSAHEERAAWKARQPGGV